MSNTPARPCTTTVLFWSNSLWWTSTPSATCVSMGLLPLVVCNRLLIRASLRARSRVGSGRGREAFEILAAGRRPGDLGRLPDVAAQIGDPLDGVGVFGLVGPDRLETVERHREVQ